MQQSINARSRESGVSEIIGAVLLIALVVAAIAIIGVSLLSHPPPKNLPALDAIISTTGKSIQITHNGGDTLQKGDFEILVDGQKRTADFFNQGNAWQTWSNGETLTFPATSPPGIVQIVYTGEATSALLSSAVFGEAGNITAQFRITTTASSCEISPAGPVPAFYGDIIGFTITPSSPNYHISDVSVDGGSVGAVSSYSIGPVNKDYTLAATCTVNTYSITPSASTGGSISPGILQTVTAGGSQGFTITPDAHYHIADVLVDGVSQGIVSGYTFTNVQASHTITASFAPDTYTITATNNTFGSITPSGVMNVTYGGSQAYTIAATTPGYHIADVLVDGVSQGTISSYTFTNVQASHTISAAFAINSYNITASSGLNGTVTPAGVTTVNFGGSQAYAIIPTTGYHIADVQVDSVSQGTVSNYTFTNVQALHTISATFAINSYNITASSGANGAITPAGVTAVNFGGSQMYTITPTPGYHIASVLVDGVSQGTISSYTFTNVQASHTISATFAINTYNITASSGANGTVTPSGVTAVNFGGSQAYAIIPTTGYHIADVLVDGVSQGTISSYTFTNVQASHTISATFAINTYNITASSGANGAIIPAGVTTVNYGATPTYAIIPNSGYHVADVLVNGTSVGAVTSYLFPAVTTDKTISATFAINTYTITATNDTFGSVTPAGVTTVNYGATPTYTITPNSGYHVADVLVNGTSVGAVASYLFPAVTTNKTISATFALNTYTITASIVGGNGNVSPADQAVNYGATPSVTFAPDTGYHLNTVTVNDNTVTPTGNSYTFPPVTTNMTLVGTFMVDPPVAGFTGTPRSGPIPLVITFNDTSTNNPASWLWNFGDGQTSTLRNPTNTYSLAGNYSVSLTVTNAGGSNSTSKDGYIFTYIPAVANFTGTPTSGPASLDTYFTDLSTGSPSSWFWDFGDGYTGPAQTTQNTGHTYNAVGVYSVNLTVANTYSSSYLLRPAYINVTTPPPVAHILANVTSGVAPLTVLLRDLSTNTPTSWLWHFDDGTADVTTKDATHIFTNPGSYNVSHTATNAGGSSTAYQMITVSTPPPTFTSITPSTGTRLGGTPVTIVGTNFVSGGSLAVTIGGAAATNVSVTDSTHITAITPAGTAGAATWVNITSGDGQSVNTPGRYTYVEPPTITGISPSSGIRASGTSVTITGTNLVGATSVAFGSNAATINTNSATAINMNAPAGTGSVTVTVMTPNGTATTSYNYFIIQVFTSSTSWTAPSGIVGIDYLVVAGGGGGGGLGGGGGAGGVQTGTLTTGLTGAKTVTIGTGGAGGTTARASNGANSVFATITATGGGGGGTSSGTSGVATGANGGSGGGGARNRAGGTGTSGQGNNGGTGGGSSTPYEGGGGGGKSVFGTTATNNVGGAGGAGTDYSATFGTGFGVSGVVAGGGGGGVTSGTAGSGGTGGGGAGAVGTAAITAGTANTGGGGGGSGVTSVRGGSGGSGVVVIKYY